MSALGRQALGAALGLLLDRALGEPPAAVHPVALFGTGMQHVENRLWRDARGPGVLHAAVGVGLGVAAGGLVRSTAVAVGCCVAGRELRRVAAGLERRLVAGDLEGARAELPSLVGRDPAQLDTSGISAAVVESLAENTVDAVVAPVFWALVAGAPGACAYRAVNTMDAMVGHRSERYRRYGWAAARTDDVANYVPARLFAALVVVVRPASAGRVLRLVRRDAPAHPSPNAGVAETAVAAVLGRELGGPLRYGTLAEDRPRLGEGPRPLADDVTAAVRLTDHTERALAAGLFLLWCLDRRRDTRRKPR